MLLLQEKMEKILGSSNRFNFRFEFNFNSQSSKEKKKEITNLDYFKRERFQKREKRKERKERKTNDLRFCV